MTNDNPKTNNCHMNEFCWNTRPNILQAFLTFGFELNIDTTCGFLPEN